MEVALIHWPNERHRRDDLTIEAMPRLLLVQPEVEPPFCLDPLEDWVRSSASDDERRARIDNLTARARARNGSHLAIDAHGVLRFRSVTAHLTPVQARLAELLIENLGAVVTRDQLIAAGWPGEPASTNSLEAHLVRLRRRIALLDLHIKTVRSRGYLMEAVGSFGPDASGV